MNPKRILFFSCDPGGAEVLIPVIESLRDDQDYGVIVLGYGYALDRFSRKGVSFIEIKPVPKDDAALLHQFSPDIMITSAASHPSKDMSEKFLWYNAKRMGIPTFAFLDQWQNYSLRFSGPGRNERLRYLPDYINCINDIAKDEMVREGFPGEILLPLGHPYLSSLSCSSFPSGTRHIRKRLHIGDDRKVILFVSEAIEEYYGNTRGYNQHDAIECLLRRAYREYPGDVIVIKLHPKEDPEKYHYLHRDFGDRDIKILTNEFTSLECLSISDMVYGMTSLMLIEAYILGKPVVSVQPNLKVDDPLVLSRHRLIPRISSFGDPLPDNAPAAAKNIFPYRFLIQDFKEFLNRKLN